MHSNAIRSTNAWLIIFVMPFFLLVATSFGFAIPAGATNPNSSGTGHGSGSNAGIGSALLQHNQRHHNQAGGQFNLASKSVIHAPPSTSAKIRSNVAINTHATTKSSTSLDASTVEIDTPISTSSASASTTTSPLRGEHQSNILSRLLYIYASQLLEISAKRRIETSDALPVPKYTQMDEQVPALQKIYYKSKKKAHKHLETLKSTSSSIISSGESNGDNGDNNGGGGYGNKSNNNKNKNLKRRINSRISKSESLILAKSIVLHQKKNLITTGVLRLINTTIQAFPAVLVSRLLRLIESGDMNHPSKPVIAALQLVGLLSVKMIVENLYFHNVIKCATMVRGSLTGLIFDKSLRLSSSSGNGGGASSTNKEKEVDGDEKKSKSEKAALGTGGVLNLMQSDVSIIESTAMQIHTIWDGLLQISIYSTLLYKYLGPSVFYGIAVLLLTIPTNSLTLRILNRLSKKEFEAKDARTKKTSEAVSNMKLLKLQGWEKHFRKGIEVQRKEELKRHINRGAFRALNNAISNAVPAIVLVVTLTAYRRTGKPIVASTIFTAISLFNQLRFPLLFYPMVVDSLANGKNSIKRLSSYLCQEELTPYVQRFSKGPEEGGGIQLKNGNFLWSSATKSSDGEHDSVIAAPALCGAELNVNSGEIVAVVGPVGSGKSALIKSLLGELEPTPRIMVDEIGTTMNTSVNDIPVVKTKGNVAYCAQESWLSKGTIRDAVLFGRDYDEEKYLTALYDAGLDEDFARGSLSHDTQVGEGGSSLSGGQRARVQLARALYDENTGVYLLDDPLSALDAAVGATVFERVTARIRQRKAAAVFVTNDASLPRRCDRVVLMGSSGSQSCSKIVDTGSYDELLSRGHDCGTNFAHEFDDDSKQQRNKTEIDPIITQHADIEVQVVMEHDAECLAERKIPPLSMEAFNDNNGNNNTVSHTSSKEQDDSQTNRISSTEKSKEVGSLDERMSTGAVPFKTYMTYLNSVRKPLLILATMGCFLMANGAQFYQQLTVAKWTELSHSSTMSSALSGRYLQTLVNAAGVVSIFLWLRSYLLMRVGTRSSEHLHNKMLHSVFNAPSTFFDSTPSGQILSRFGSELGIVDNSVPDGIGSVLYCFLNIFITVLGLAGVVTPKITLPVVFIGIFYKMIMAKFRPAARDLKRCESKTRSPIYTHFGETLRGVETIRSYPGSSLLWSSNLRNLVDTNLSVFTSVKHLDRWLSIRLESLGNAVVLMAAFASVILTRSGKLKAGSAGWGLTQSLAITGLLTWAVRTLTDLESQMMSVMRVTELTNIDSTTSSNKKIPLKIPQEYEAPGDAINTLFNNNGALLPTAPSQDRALIQSGWPWKGEISFNNASMRYNSASELALKNVTLTVPAGTTLGIVGRTGSGKSSLLLTLFRLIEIEKGGAILIDGVDIRSISLQTLRNTLSIIPQDPTLFSGTLMYNLDATMKSKPEDAWLALEAASPDLANEFRRSGLGLDTMIEEGGTNYSAGQRQLICLARALLRRSKILVLDEATSSVDPNTDAQVQETIRKEFVDKGVSVITVAHRLDTVMGSDKIAVLGDGELIEYGHPEELLLNRDGHLRRLVDADTENKRKGAVVSSNSESMEKVAV